MSDDAVRKGRIKLVLLGTVLSLPVVAAYLLYFFGPPVDGTVNYGDLLEPVALPDPELRLLDGRGFRLSDLKGRWVMLQAGAGACDEGCRARLYAMRQVRKIQGKEMHRIERVWLVTDGSEPDAALVSDYEGTWVVTGGARTILEALPAADAAVEHIFIIDPLGNLMLRFPRNADPNRMKKDVGRLLKVSRIG